MPGSCCLSFFGGCQDVQAESDCVNGVYTEGVACAETDCSVFDGACCRPDGTCIDGVNEPFCVNVANGVFQGIGTLCSGVDCTPPPTNTGACCLSETECQNDVTSVQCFAIGGQYMGNGTDCEGVECPDSGCRTARTEAEYAEGDKAYSLDMCERAVGMFGIRPESHVDPSFDLEGYAYPVTAHEVRAVYQDGDQCRVAYGSLVRGHDGYVRPVMCSKPELQNSSRRWAFGHFGVNLEPDPDGLIPDGYVYMVLPIQNPPWNEVQYHNSPRMCEALV